MFIAHAPAAMQFSTDPPPEGWCQEYLAHHAIDSCGAQINRIDTYDGVIWFVLAAWSEAKQWCGTEFGLGAYEEGVFTITEHGACFPGEGLEIPTDRWPGPNEGTAIVTTSESWSGNFVPVYYFTGYAYAEGVMPLAINPSTGGGGMANCSSPPNEWDAAAFGAMGVFTEGASVCPSEGGGHVLGPGGGGGLEPTGGGTAVCCYDGTCQITTEAECMVLGGGFYPEWTSCNPNPCIVTLSPDGSGDYPTIQAAVDAVGTGMAIELLDGTYSGEGNHNVSFQGKAITIRSCSDDPLLCVVDCAEDGDPPVPQRGFFFWDHEGLDAKLRGLKIRNARAGGYT